MVWVLLIFVGVSLSSCSNKVGTLKSKNVQFYKETYRPQFHFTPKEKWMNDPNGMVYYKGEYHLFYQHYPDSTVWGPMHWGHAVSKDLVDWEHLPIALYPDSLGYIFSGSAVIDWKNTSGFGSETDPAMVAIFTHRHLDGKPKGFESQSLAYSTDRGRSWTKYKNNPVLSDPNSLGFRDPKVFWHEDTQKWIMALSAEDRIKLFSSKDLKAWKLESQFGQEIGAHGGVWECPDLFELPVEGTSKTKWVMLVSIGDGGPNKGSATQYFIGEFDGANFIPDTEETRWIDQGKDNYAGVTWSDLPEKGKRIFVGWMSNWQYANNAPTHPWRSAMTIPREFKVISVGDGGYQLVSQPVDNLSELRSDKKTITSQVVSPDNQLTLSDERLDQHEYNLEFQIPSNDTSERPQTLLLEWSNEDGEKMLLGYDFDEEGVFIDRTNSGVTSFSKEFPVRQFAPYTLNQNLKLQIYMDWSSMEVFVNDGKLVMTSLVFPSKPYNQLRIYTESGEVSFTKGAIWKMNSIWK